MSRSRPRTAGILLPILALTVAVGVSAFATQYKKNKALAAAPGGGPGAPGNAVVKAPPAPNPDDGAVVTSTPGAGSKPATVTGAPSGGAQAVAQPTGTSSTSAPATPVVRPPAAPPASMPNVIAANKTLASAKALADAGKLLEAREAYNVALISGKLTQDETRATKFEMAHLNETI